MRSVWWMCSRLLKNAASGVLASLRGSTYRSVRLASSLAAALPVEGRVLARRGWAGETSGRFGQPAELLEPSWLSTVAYFSRPQMVYEDLLDRTRT